MEYIKDASTFSCLAPFKEHFRTIREEFIAFRDAEERHGTFNEFAISASASTSIRSTLTDWKVYAFYLHYRNPIELMLQYNIEPTTQVAKDAMTASRLWEVKPLHFGKTRKLCEKLMGQPDNRVINIFLSYHEPGTRVGLHINNDPYMYRAHLGIVVPEGHVGFKVGDETVTWKEGEMFVFAPVNPHTAWNLTDQGRAVLIVDFLRPDEDQEQMRRLEREQFNQAMDKDPTSFGMSGYFPLSDDLKRKFAIPWVESATVPAPIAAT